MNEANTIELNIGQVKAAKPPIRLRTSALGSCVACVLYDRVEQVGGMAHVMLPSTDHYLRGTDPFKYADEAIPYLIKLMVDAGANRYSLHARLVGGANVVEDPHTNRGIRGEALIENNATIGVGVDIGRQVIKSCQDILYKHGIEIVAQRVGGRENRSVILDTETGTLWYSENNGIEKAL